MIINDVTRFISLFLSWISQYRYSVLVLILFLKFFTFATNGFWSGDFWEHSAAVKEFIERSSHPQHPLFLLDAPSAFMSPYAFLVAALARTLSLNAIDALSIFSLFNFLLFAFGLKRFCSVVSPVRGEVTAFYTLLFTLFLWGNSPWPYSGFLHFEIIETVLPYPSSFSIALSLIGLSLFLKPFTRFITINNLLLFIIVWFVLLSHPLTFIFLLSGLFFLSFSSDLFPFKKLLSISLVIFLAGITALFWPYFSLYDLLVGGSKVYHTSNLVMYLNVWDRIWPNFILLPILFWASRFRILFITFLWLISLCILYVYGTVSSNYSYGRIISYCILIFHIIAACGLSYFESIIIRTHSLIYKSYHVLLISILFILSMSWLPFATTRLLTLVNQIYKNTFFVNQNTYKNLVFLNRYISSDQLVLSDINTSWLVPSFGGKVIAALHPQAFVDDFFDRQTDINIFFDSHSTIEQRINIIRKYKPHFLLLDLQNEVSSIIENDFKHLIELLDSNERFRLFKFQ